MRKSRVLLLAFLIAALFSVSCSKEEMSVSNLQTQPYVKADGTMGLSVYASVSVPSRGKSSYSKDGSLIQMVVTSPDGNLSWSFDAAKADFGGISYYGSPDIVMPQGQVLPKGKWNLDVIDINGNVVSMQFDISYTDSASALENLASSDRDAPWFDSSSNLTVLP